MFIKMSIIFNNFTQVIIIIIILQINFAQKSIKKKKPLPIRNYISYFD